MGSGRRQRTRPAASSIREAPAEGKRMRFGQSSELRDLWLETGLEDVATEALEVVERYESFDDYWEPFTAGIGPGGAYFASLRPEVRRPFATSAGAGSAIRPEPSSWEPAPGPCADRPDSVGRRLRRHRPPYRGPSDRRRRDDRQPAGASRVDSLLTFLVFGPRLAGRVTEQQPRRVGAPSASGATQTASRDRWVGQLHHSRIEEALRGFLQVAFGKLPMTVARHPDRVRSPHIVSPRIAVGR